MEIPDLNMELPAQVNQTTNNSAGGDYGSILKEKNQLIPLARVTAIMESILPEDATLSEESTEFVQQCLSRFISFITGKANEICHGELRRVLTADDVLRAMDGLGFDDYIQPLTTYLQRLREHNAGSLEPSRERVNNPVNHGMETLAPDYVPHYLGFASLPAPSRVPAQAPMSGIFNDGSGAGPSRVAGANLEPFGQGAMGRGTGPAQVAGANPEPFWLGPGAMGRGERRARGE